MATTPTDSSRSWQRWSLTIPRYNNASNKTPVATLRSLSEPVSGDKWIYRMVVMALGLTALFVLLGVFTLKALDALVAIGSAAIATLAALLAPSPARR
jgi:hypothetical protein